MIQSLSIARFKSIRPLAIECRRVNVFIGPPDTGKTNILEALHLLSRFGFGLPIDESLRLSPELGFETLFYRQFFDEPLCIAVTGTPAITFEVRISNQALIVQPWNLPVSFGTSWAAAPGLDVIRYYSFLSSTVWTYGGGGHRGTELVSPVEGRNLLYIARHNSKVYDYLKDLVADGNWKLRFDQNLKTFRLSEVRENDILDYPLDVLSDSVKRLFFYGAIVKTSKDATLVFDEPDVFAFPPYPKTLGDMIAADAANQYFLSTHNPYFLSSLVEKSPAGEISIFVCSRDGDGGTVARRVSAEGMQRVVELGDSTFFNLDQLPLDP